MRVTSVVATVDKGCPAEATGPGRPADARHRRSLPGSSRNLGRRLRTVRHRLRPAARGPRGPGRAHQRRARSGGRGQRSRPGARHPRPPVAPHRLPRVDRPRLARHRRHRHRALGRPGSSRGPARVAAAWGRPRPRAGVRHGRLARLRPGGAGRDVPPGDGAGLSGREGEGGAPTLEEDLQRLQAVREASASGRF